MPKHRKFVAGDTAPNALNAYHGAYITSQVGNLALQLIFDNSHSIIFERDVVPPRLTLRSAPVKILFGETSAGGQFIPHDNKATGHKGLASGLFNGPGSQLEVS